MTGCPVVSSCASPWSWIRMRRVRRPSGLDTFDQLRTTVASCGEERGRGCAEIGRRAVRSALARTRRTDVSTGVVGVVRNTVRSLVIACGTAALAGQPSQDVLQLRSVEVRRCEPLTSSNVFEVSSFVRAAGRGDRARGEPSAVARSTPGFVIEGVVHQRRDLSFSVDGKEPVADTGWGADSAKGTLFFFSSQDAGTCRLTFRAGRLVNVVVSNKAECDTYPPEGVCAFDLPIRLVDSVLWARFGHESVAFNLSTLEGQPVDMLSVRRILDSNGSPHVALDFRNTTDRTVRGFDFAVAKQDCDRKLVPEGVMLGSSPNIGSAPAKIGHSPVPAGDFGSLVIPDDVLNRALQQLPCGSPQPLELLLGSVWFDDGASWDVGEVVRSGKARWTTRLVIVP
jgi:hypothetical protein